MLTFSNTIVTDKTFLNLNLVKTVLFFQQCTSHSGKFSQLCHVIFYTDGNSHIITECLNVPEYLMFRDDLIPVIRDKKLFDNLTELSITENE